MSHYTGSFLKIWRWPRVMKTFCSNSYSKGKTHNYNCRCFPRFIPFSITMFDFPPKESTSLLNLLEYLNIYVKATKANPFDKNGKHFCDILTPHSFPNRMWGPFPVTQICTLRENGPDTFPQWKKNAWWPWLHRAYAGSMTQSTFQAEQHRLESRKPSIFLSQWVPLRSIWPIDPA